MNGWGTKRNDKEEQKMEKQGNKKGQKIIQRNETHRPKRHAILLLSSFFASPFHTHTHMWM